MSCKAPVRQFPEARYEVADEEEPEYGRLVAVNY
jgi:hypothetical protein